MGLEWLQPLEQLLRHHDRSATVRPLKRVTEVVTEFSARGLDLPDEGVTWFWESLYLRDHEPIALSQEWIPAGTDLTASTPCRSPVTRSRSRTSPRVTPDGGGPGRAPWACGIDRSNPANQVDPGEIGRRTSPTTNEFSAGLPADARGAVFSAESAICGRLR